MNDTPLISVITVTYNAAKDLLPTMQSVAEQMFGDYEHLLIDGASTDDTLTLVRRHGTEQLRIISERDKGLYDAMNKALRHARGKYVLFLNAGDAFHSPSTLEQYAQAAMESDADIVYADTVVVDENRRILRARHLSAPERLTADSFSHGMLICHQAFMARRELCPQYDLNYKLSADYDWCLKVIKASREDHMVNLETIAIDFLDGGMTNKHHMRGLRERFDIMQSNYGLPLTLWRHAGFVFRALGRKLKH